MGGSSSSSTSRTYNTTNLSQQGRTNVAGDNNRVSIERADARALERVADTLGGGVEDLTKAGTEQLKAALAFSEKSSMSAMDFVSEYVEREQVGTQEEELKTLQFTGAAVAVALVGIAWASK